MKKFALVLTGLLASTVMASAADLAARPYTKAPPPVAAVYNWTGFYIGVNGGGGWGRSRFDFSPIGTTTGNYNVSGGLAGGTAGYNWQIGQWVVGAEGDIDWSGVRGTNGNRPTLPVAGGFVCNGPVAAGGTGFACGTDNTWIATVRGRAGVAFNNVLLFGTAGVAFGDVRARIASDPGFGIFGGTTSTQVGWTAGAGVEWGFLPNWSLKGEYRYVDLGSVTCGVQTVVGGGGCDPTNTARVPFRENIGLVGINYHFSGPVVAKY
jgi:outer membrane immunogenic protein